MRSSPPTRVLVFCDRCTTDPACFPASRGRGRRRGLGCNPGLRRFGQHAAGFGDLELRLTGGRLGRTGQRRDRLLCGRELGSPHDLFKTAR